MPTITPSLPAASLKELLQLAEALKGVAPMIQVDIVDGVFAPHTSWPFTEADSIAALGELRTLTNIIPVEVDCMVREPERYIDSLIASGVSSIILHFGSTDEYEALSLKVRNAGLKIGIAIMNDTDLSEVVLLLPLFDFVQVMGIREVGAQGQPFDERTLDTLRALRALDSSLTLVVDGAVNATTVSQLTRAGANRLAPGSAVAKAPDSHAAYEQLSALAAQ